MSANSDRSKVSFVFTWNIENFGMCPLQNNESFTSPVFSPGMAKDLEFVLRLYPRGDDKEKNMSCFLERVDDSTQAVTLSFDILVRCRNTASNIKKPDASRVFDKDNRMWPSQKLVSFEEVIQDFSAGMLVNDVMTLKCHLWVTDIGGEVVDDNFVVKRTKLSDVFPELTQPLPNEGDDVIRAVKKQFLCYPSEVITKTQIQVQRKDFKWRISDFSSCMEHSKELSIPLKCQFNRDPPLLLVMNFDSPSETEAAKIEIRRTKSQNEEPFLLNCKIVVMGSRTESVVVKESSRFFKLGEDSWSYPPIIKKTMVTSDKSIYLPNDVLTLKCSLILSTGTTNSWTEEILNSTVEYQNLLLSRDGSSKNLKNDFQRLYEEKSLCDVTLKVQRQSMKAHKAVLIARSDVLKAMFEADMREKKSSSIRIEDVDADTLRSMLKFMYTDALDVQDVGEAIALYTAADKYQVLQLKKACLDFIRGNLSLENIYDVLLLLDLHEDCEMETVVLDLFCTHKTKILKSEEWIQFMKTYARVSRLVLYKICLKLPEI